jgi:hypothetical protein
MPCTINASITSTGLIHSADATGNLELQGNGTTGLTVNNSGKVVIANTALSTASAGTLEYDGGELYFTPLGTQRGLIPGMQYYRLNSTVAGANSTSVQSVFGVGCTLSANTVYQFEIFYCITKSAGVTSHTVSSLFGGTATLNNINYSIFIPQSSVTGTVNGVPTTTIGYGMYIQQASATVITGAIALAAQAVYPSVKGTVSVSTGGTFIPQYQLSAAPGGAYTTQAGSYFLIYPIGSSGSNTNIGTWA